MSMILFHPTLLLILLLCPNSYSEIFGQGISGTVKKVGLCFSGNKIYATCKRTHISRSKGSGEEKETRERDKTKKEFNVKKEVSGTKQPTQGTQAVENKQSH
ncbi:hypothetical protein YC2023_085147 [Brassica napus]